MVVQARCWWPVCSCPEPSPTPSPAPFPRPQVLGEPSSEGDLIGSTEAALACRAFCRGQVSSQLTCPASGPLGIFNCIFLSVQSCPTLCDAMDCSTPGLPILRQLLELSQTHVHRVSDAIQPSHPLSSPSPPIFNLSLHQGLFQ